MTARFPAPLRKGDTIGITAFSSGVDERLLRRLEHIIAHLRERGYRVDEGHHVRQTWPALAADKGASASAIERAAELNEFLHDPKLKAIAPPWGGELAIQVLSFIDFAELARVEPKWVFGFSDVSTLMLPLTLCAGWATLHCSNLMDLAAAQSDALTTSVFDILGTPPGQQVTQLSSDRWQLRCPDWETQPTAAFNRTESTAWKRYTGHVVGGTAQHDALENAPVTFDGRLIGGCLNTLRHLVGTPFGDVPAYVARNRARDEGTILYLEDGELAPLDLARTLCGLRLAGWFDGLSGVLVGRSSGALRTETRFGETQSNEAHSSAANECHAPYTFHDALYQCLDNLPYPILYDVDIGHRQPQLCLINGANARVKYESGAGRVTQTLA